MATPDEMAQTMLRNLPEKTGKSLQEWLILLGKSPLVKHGELVALLKKEHGVTHGFANLIVSKFRSSFESDDIDFVGIQYSGRKSALRPIYDLLVDELSTFGADVEISPKKTYVSIRRRKQFAIIQPSTKTRVDLGLNITDAEVTGRLELSGSFNAMVSHRIRLSTSDDIDSQLLKWLRLAYKQAK